jgi:hypothetical protein
MFSLIRSREQPRGQILVLTGLSLTLIVFAAGLVIDVGTGLAQRREAQNASDFAALAGARVMAYYVSGDTANGTDANVADAITNAAIENRADPPVFGAPDGPQYVAENGTLLGFVGDGIPTGAVGVQVTTERSWDTFFVRLFGVSTWSTNADARAVGGFAINPPPPGGLFPAGISTAFFEAFDSCDGPISNVPGDPCYPKNLTPGNLNVPGGFGWLKFGCDGYGLGQDPSIPGDCENNVPFMDEQIGPPPNSFGCCTQVGISGPDRIGSAPGNMVAVDCSYYIDNEITVWVPVWDTAGGSGNNAWYHIVGFAAFQITECEGGKNIAGVWRQAFSYGPVGTTPPSGGFGAVTLAVQLVK